MTNLPSPGAGGADGLVPQLASLQAAGPLTGADASLPIGGAGQRSLPRGLIVALSFWGGFHVMALEMCGLRALQTYLGSSVVVTGTLLSVVMALLAGGYYFGGRLSARGGDPSLLFALLGAGGLYAQLVSVLSIDRVGSFALTLNEAWSAHPYRAAIVPASLLTLVLYGPPMFLLSTLSPYWIRLWSVSNGTRRGDAGVASGLFMALSTGGSILGTAASSYLLIPGLGVALTCAVSNVVFLALVAWGWRSSALGARASLLLPLASGLAAAASLIALRFQVLGSDPSVIYQAESQYGQMRVVQSRDDAGRPVLYYHPSRVYTHSVLHPQDPLRQTDALMYLVPGLVRPPRDVLVLGSAAGAILRKLGVAFPEAKVTGVDLDPKVHELATRIFEVDPAQSTLLTSDARVHLLDDTRDYDLIIVDLFAGEFIPTHCITLEFFRLVRSRLRAGGAMFVNTNMNDVPYELASDSEPFRPIRHLEATIRAAGFPTLFENAFFHSLFVFPDPMSSAGLRLTLLDRLRDPSLSPALRVGAGVAAYTTVAVETYAGRYAPFTDAWSPAPLIELKSNERALYTALRDGVAGEIPAANSARGSRIRALALEQRFVDLDRGGEGELRDLGPFYAALNALDDDPGPPDIELAAEVFRPGWEPLPTDVAPVSAWAKLAATYARIYELGRKDDREALLPELLSASDLLGQSH
jgi:hypothetical protein